MKVRQRVCAVWEPDCNESVGSVGGAEPRAIPSEGMGVAGRCVWAPVVCGGKVAVSQNGPNGQVWWDLSCVM